MADIYHRLAEIFARKKLSKNKKWSTALIEYSCGNEDQKFLLQKDNLNNTILELSFSTAFGDKLVYPIYKSTNFF